MDRRGSRLSRREFVVGASGLGLLVGCGRLPWQAQPRAKVYRVAYLIYGFPEALPAPGAPVYEALVQGLREYGYVEGQNLAMEYRGTAQGEQRIRELVAELVQLPVDVIVARPGRARPASRARSGAP